MCHSAEARYTLTNRFINFCTGDKILATEDPRPHDNLPAELDAWQEEVVFPTTVLYVKADCN